MKHPHAELLIAAANDKDARFTYPRVMAGEDPVPNSILGVLNNPHLPWKLVEKPDKWAKEKQAYDEGKIIQARILGEYNWKSISNPKFIEGFEYRIKPQTEARYLWANKYGSIPSALYQNPPNDHYTIRLDWSATEFEVA